MFLEVQTAIKSKSYLEIIICHHALSFLYVHELVPDTIGAKTVFCSSEVMFSLILALLFFRKEHAAGY